MITESATGVSWVLDRLIQGRTGRSIGMDFPQRGVRPESQPIVRTRSACCVVAFKRKEPDTLCLGSLVSLDSVPLFLSLGLHSLSDTTSFKL